ncbi:hypothetical protein ACUNHX_03310 [Serratia sp. IR-2025]|uniref:hypothetical protein n=1 Tax=Serratia marcescens TaxID=615 RepID=UPI001D15277F|nr:hypothetical protein [Serratia marcescens]MCX2172756.1 hypothetical protein [Serratia marcescens]MCX2176017.1 hypothetical protein [Serratia marcescens]WAZ05005.1 hypothetical protein O3T12_17610 [Serratia marcescens]
MMDNKLSELSKPVAWKLHHHDRYYFEENADVVAIAESMGQAKGDAVYSQEYVSALQHESAVNWEAAASLVAESEELKRALEASKKSNAFLKEQLAQLANFNPDWDMLEACRESWREVAAALKEAETTLEAKDKRIAELERANQSQDDHINQQQDRIDSLEKKNGDLGRSLGAAEKRLATSVRFKVGTDSVDSDVSDRNQPGMVVAVHVDAGDFVKVKGQVYEVKETCFDDHDVTLWFVCGEVLKCAAGCQIEVVSAPEGDA